jgi:hypothetical protein
MTMVWPHMDMFSHHADPCNIVHRHINDKQFEIIPKKVEEKLLKHKIWGRLLIGVNLSRAPCSQT